MRKGLLSFALLLAVLLMLTGCSSASDYYRNGKKSYTSGNYEEAASYFNKAIAANPNRAEYYIDYGMTLIALEKYKDAIKEFDQVYQEKDIFIIKENNKRALRGKGIAYYQMKQYKKAIEQFQAALEIRELSKLDMDILNYTGSALISNGSYKEAIDIYSRLLTHDHKNDIALSERALCYRYLGEYKKSLSDYEKAITINPGCYDYYFGEYYLLSENQKEKEAADILSKAEKIEVKNSEDEYNLAKVHYYQGSFDAALSELSEGFSNGFQEAYYYIGEIYREKKDYETAVYYYEMYIKKDKSMIPSVYNQLSSSLIKTGDYKKAIQYIEQGLKLNQIGTDQILRKNEIIAYEYQGMFDTAMEKLKDYRKSYPKDQQAIREEEFLKTRLMESSVNPDIIKLEER